MLDAPLNCCSAIVPGEVEAALCDISPGINAPAQQQTGSADDEPPEQEHDAHPRKREIVEKMAELIAQAKALGEMTGMAGEMADMLEEMSWQLNETAAELLELTKLPGV